MLPWLLVTVTSAPAVDVPELLCLHDVTHLSPSVEVAHVAPSIDDLAHGSPTVTAHHREC